MLHTEALNWPGEPPKWEPHESSELMQNDAPAWRRFDAAHFFGAKYGMQLCRDLHVDFCTRCYDARIPVKALQSWMGHASTQRMMEISSKLTKEEEEKDAARLATYTEKGYEAEESNSHGTPWVTAC